MKIGVKILPKPEVLDTQGRAVNNLLKHNNQNLNDVKVGRYVVLDFPETDQKQCLEKAKEMCQFVLHNPLIENYELEVLK